MITGPMSWVYSLGIGKRNRDFDAGKGVTTLDYPVISIGNLSTGGTGKTPMVNAVVRLLQQAGHRPVIAKRGYGSKPGQKGDEQIEHEMALPGVPIVAQPDRTAGLRALFASEQGRSVDCIVLDDGFQHRQISRDLDIVLIDASRPPDRDALLPRGHLREPVGSLSRVDLVVLTHAERVEPGEIDRLRALVGGVAPGVPVCSARHVWSGANLYTRTEQGWEEQSITLDQIQGKPVRVVCGIGNSGAFVRMVREHGMAPERVVTLADHAQPSSAQLSLLTSPANGSRFPPIVMTRKDWVKARSMPDWPIMSVIYVPELRINFDDAHPVEAGLRGAWVSDRR